LAKAKEMSDLTIVYYTDNRLPLEFERRCQRELIKAAEGKPIISVSQKPLDFGENICVGDIGSSVHSIFAQALAGVSAARTRYIGLAEHDCLYTAQHYNWTPPDDETFYYNVAHWFVDFATGRYAYYRRKPMSMLICARDLFVRSVERKLQIIEAGYERWMCEPGVIDHRAGYIAARAGWRRVLCDVGKEDDRAAAFRTELQNLDIRHGRNYSGDAYARYMCKHTAEELPYWGKFREYWEAG
jgi:hypothetical protein